MATRKSQPLSVKLNRKKHANEKALTNPLNFNTTSWSNNNSLNYLIETSSF